MSSKQVCTAIHHRGLGADDCARGGCPLGTKEDGVPPRRSKGVREKQGRVMRRVRCWMCWWLDVVLLGLHAHLRFELFPPNFCLNVFRTTVFVWIHGSARFGQGMMRGHLSHRFQPKGTYRQQFPNLPPPLSHSQLSTPSQ